MPNLFIKSTRSRWHHHVPELENYGIESTQQELGFCPTYDTKRAESPKYDIVGKRPGLESGPGSRG
ncbi:hypothetical protein PM082_006373 [Marasmius tenuissimus]|nr:hypothetical protein PM082_006373 [Marasmius tenuissimus]